jgi:NAD(P)-dependent dehydrogenase (short-subunit alcohol dehydrogenase family)
LRQESGPHIRVTEISPGFVDTDFADASITDPEVRATILKAKERLRSRRTRSQGQRLS